MDTITIEWNTTPSGSYLPAGLAVRPNVFIYGDMRGVNLAFKVVRLDSQLSFEEVTSEGDCLELTFRGGLQLEEIEEYLKQLSGRIQSVLHQEGLNIRVDEHENLFAYVRRARI